MFHEAPSNSDKKRSPRVQQNPYQPPVAGWNTAPPQEASHAALPESVIDALKKTRPWVLFLGILGFIACGLLAVVGVIMTAMAFVVETKGVPPWLGLVYLPLAGLYVAPSVYMTRYASAIGTFLRSPSGEGLGNALKQQKSFWRFVGILTLVLMVIYAIVLIGALAVGVGTVLMSKPHR
jgi:hypothetical protein